MSFSLDFVWINEQYVIVMESFTTRVLYENIQDISPYYVDNYVIKPIQIFKNPFKNENDKIILCDLYYINYLTYPPELIISENNKRENFDTYMEKYSGRIFKITQTYVVVKNLFREHKQMCKYIGIDVFGKQNEYSIFAEKENVYNYVWMSRYILYQLSSTDIEWGELLLVTNEEEDITDKMINMDMAPIDELLNDMIL